jgi:hypothetical protein
LVREWAQSVELLRCEGSDAIGAKRTCGEPRKRVDLKLLGGAATWPLAAHAQQLDRVRRIGVLMGLLRATLYDSGSKTV